MREILFRGKCITSGKWAKGNYLKEEKNVYITYNYESALGDLGTRNALAHNVIVDFKTIGQYTGLKDKNGKKIFEGDIVKNKQNYVYTVSYDECGFKMEEAFGNKIKMVQDSIDRCGVEVIGNIHDNTELLEK